MGGAEDISPSSSSFANGCESFIQNRFNKPVPNMFWPLKSAHIQLLTSALSPENPQQFRLTPRGKLTTHSTEDKEQQHAAVSSRADPLGWRASTQGSQHYLSQLSPQEVTCCRFFPVKVERGRKVLVVTGRWTGKKKKGRCYSCREFGMYCFELSWGIGKACRCRSLLQHLRPSQKNLFPTASHPALHFLVGFTPSWRADTFLCLYLSAQCQACNVSDR